MIPHQAQSAELYLKHDDASRLRNESVNMPSPNLSPRAACDLELLLNGAFEPLNGFLKRNDYQSVLERMRLADGTLFPIPIVLDVDPRFADALVEGESVIALRDVEGAPIAAMDVEDLWIPDKTEEAIAVYGTDNPQHPGVKTLLEDVADVYVGGRLRGIAPPAHYDFPRLRRSPNQLKELFARMGWRRVVGFQTRNPMHRAHHAMTAEAARRCEAALLIHPVVGLTAPGDIDRFARMKCYEAILERYPKDSVALAPLDLAMRMAGPREALWHAAIRRNHGCTHFIVGRHHASPAPPKDGKDFYAPYEARDLALKHQEELGIEIVAFDEMVYARERGRYVAASEMRDDEPVGTLSGTELRRRLRDDEPIPEWFSFPEVVAELKRRVPTRRETGFCVLFTGLSGAGKSTVAKALEAKISSLDRRRVTLLDGDAVRRMLSSELSFSREHRDLNIRRIAFVAAEIVKNGGAAICAPIAPFAEQRRDARRLIEPHGEFLEVWISTPLEVCEKRDPKGHYRLARQGKITQFTGISDPYEEPKNPDLELDASIKSPDECAAEIILKLRTRGLFG